jgi:hypothetical protein
MSELTLFKDNPLATSDAFQSLMDTNDKLIGGGGEYRRISIKGGKFRQILNGEQVQVSKDDTMNIIIVDSAPIARTYFEGSYDPNADPIPPACWSHDTDVPAPDVENPQASRCADCPQNIKGSGQGNSRACRFSQRLAVAIEGDLDKIYQFQIPATSIFGEAKENALPMQGYARLLKEHKTPVAAVVTQMRFDPDAEVPKLYFSPVRPLEEAELTQVVELRDSEQVKHALEMTVSQTDGVQGAGIPVDRAGRPMEDADGNKLSIAEREAAAEREDKNVKELFPDAKKDEEVAEPKKMQKKTVAPPSEDSDDLSSIVGEWDDDE